MMVDHEFSLMKTAERPDSFYSNDTVPAGGIYISPDIRIMTVGDTLFMEVLVTPSNALDKGYSIEVSGDTRAVEFDSVSGLLIAVATGNIQLAAIIDEDETVTFSRSIEVVEIPVTAITITPSEAEMMVDDTIHINVEVSPADATVREYTFEVIDTASVIEFDSISGIVVAKKAGSAQIIARWVNGDVSGRLDITVSDATHAWNGGVLPRFTLYPNPNDGLLYVTCDQEIPIELRILDMRGKLIIEEEYTGKTIIGTASLTPGTYLVVHSSQYLILRDKLIML